MKKIEYFDYRNVARDMKVPASILKKIEKEVKDEFPKDKMMYELHVLRAIRSRYWENSRCLNQKTVDKRKSKGVCVQRLWKSTLTDILHTH